MGRLEGKQFSDGTARITYTYDPVGNRASMIDAGGLTTYAYDPVNRTTQVNHPDSNTVTYSYDEVGNRDGMTDPDGGRFTYTHDAANRLETITNPAGELTTLGYDAAGRQDRIDHANGVNTTHLYDAAGRPTVVTHKQTGGTVLERLTYAYDDVGNRESATANDGSVTTFGYDSTYRLVNEHRTGSNSHNTTHTYDPVGNRLFEDADGQRSTFTYDAANQLETRVEPTGTNPTHNYTYDGAGNLRKDQRVGVPAAWWYDWNAQNQLTQLTPGAADPVEYQYDGDGLRTEIKEGDFADNRFIWDQNNLLMDKNAAGATQAVYTLAPRLYGNLLSQRRGSTSHFHLFDALGSTIGLTNASETLSDSYLYKAYGETLASSGSTVNPFKWVGQVGYYDDPLSSALHYVRARYYNPALARWMSEDPVSFDAGDLNLYQYVNSQPVDWRDATGLLSFCEFATGPGGACVSAICGGISFADCILSCLGPVGKRALAIANVLSILDCVCDVFSSLTVLCCIGKTSLPNVLGAIGADAASCALDFLQIRRGGIFRWPPGTGNPTERDKTQIWMLNCISDCFLGFAEGGAGGRVDPGISGLGGLHQCASALTGSDNTFN